MIALSVRQPWANLIARGQKTIETRTWKTAYRGPILICAGLKADRDAMAFFRAGGPHWEAHYPTGVALAMGVLEAVEPMGKGHEAQAIVPARPGLFAWRLARVRRVQPFAVRGQLGLFSVVPPAPLRFLDQTTPC